MSQIKVLFICFTFFSFTSFAEEFQVKDEQKALGKRLESSVTLRGAGAPELGSVQTAKAEARIKVLGKSISYLRTDLTVTDQNTTELRTYAFGKQISNALEIENEGLLKWKAVLPPVEYKITPIIYPIGPVVLRVDAGVRGQGEMNAEIQPTIIIPVEQSKVRVVLGLGARADGFVEGSGKFLVIKAGLRGELLLVDANANLNSTFSFTGEPPVVSYDGDFRAFDGSIFAFLDVFNIFRFRYKRLWSRDLFKWNGICRSFDSTNGFSSCTN